MENNSTLENILLVLNRNAELLRLVGATFDAKVMDKEEKFHNSEKFTEKKFAIFCFICLSLLTFELSIESVRKIVICSLHILITVLYLKVFSVL